MNLPQYVIPMTYEDYFGADPVNGPRPGHYANTKQPYNAIVTVTGTITATAITSYKTTPTLSTLTALLTATPQAISQFPQITTTATVPSGIVTAVLNSVATQIGTAITNATSATATDVQTYLNSNVLDGNGNYHLMVGNVQTIIVLKIQTTLANANADLTVNASNDPNLDANLTYITFGGVRKFINDLPTAGTIASHTANNLGNYIPVGVPNQTAYPGSDYYEIGLIEFNHQFHSDLGPTKVRGYVQLNDPADPATYNPDGTLNHIPVAHYAGVIINATKNVPVRVKFTNFLPPGSGGDLFVPCDTSLMGAGQGNSTTNPSAYYTQNRADIHMHGGVTPWISDGTPHQWTTPVNEALVNPNNPYLKGASMVNVPDMPNPGPGSTTYYYTNQQSARLMWYHDHSYGITRLNVYVGEASFFTLGDDVEAGLVGSVLPDAAHTHFLLIQDKTFVPPDEQLDFQDPTWNRGRTQGNTNPSLHNFPWGGENSFWLPHVYLPNQNPNIPSGANDSGRWDYGPWMWPPFTGLVYDPLYDSQGRSFPAIPNPSNVPEAFVDTPIINGCAYPYLEVQQAKYRFRILNACTDRSLNLQLHKAITNDPVQTLDSNGNLTDLHTNSGDVNMVPAGPCPSNPPFPPSWPIDGRDGGVPDPTKIGPKIVQFGNECGFLPYPVVHDNTPVGYEYNRRNIVFGNVSYKNLYMSPAERADIIVDFSGAQVGDKIILYNDAPAATPAFDPRYDYYTGCPDQTDSGGAPSTLPGYGSNTRTLLQFRVVAGGTYDPTYDNYVTNTTWLDTVLAPAIGTAFKKSQDIPLVPEAEYYELYSDPNLGGPNWADPSLYQNVDYKARIGDNFLSYKNINVSATATATVSAGKVTAITVTNPGSDYVAGVTGAASVVVIDAPTGVTGPVQATAHATFSDGTLNSVSISNAGSGYQRTGVTIAGPISGNPNYSVSTFAYINLGGPGPTGATGPVGSIFYIPRPATSAFLSPPTVTINPPTAGVTGAIQATATVTLSGGSTGTVTAINITNPGAGYLPIVNVSGGGGGVDPAQPNAYVAPIGTAVLAPGGNIVAVDVTNHGYGFWSVPQVIIDAPPMGGTQATATASVARGQITGFTVTNQGSGYMTVPNVTIVSSPTVLPACSVTIGNGAITSVNITNQGSGYTSAPTVTVSASPLGPPYNATMTATILAGKVNAITITNPGYGYTAVPTITISAPTSGTRATATAVVQRSGLIAAATVTNPGSGVASPLTITVVGPPGTGSGGGGVLSGSVTYKGAVTGVVVDNQGNGYLTAPKVTIVDKLGLWTTAYLQPKSMAEEFTLDYGRMNATFGVEIPLTDYRVQTTIMYGFVDPPTEILNFNAYALAPVRNDGTQLWKITHNGVDTHSIHFHLVNVQLVNRVGWDGMIADTDYNELGWKETIRMNPLQDVIVAMRAVAPGLPFGLPYSNRLLDVTMAPGGTSDIIFSNTDPLGNPVTTVNNPTNFGWEYVWHCHILGHEENDMMRPVVMLANNQVPNAFAISFKTPLVAGQNTITWSNPQSVSYLNYNLKGIVSITVERATSSSGPWTTIATLLSNANTYVDTVTGLRYYRVKATNQAGTSTSNVISRTA